MRRPSPLPALAFGLLVVLGVLGAGTALGFGPLAASVPPSEVADPREMMARSLQAVLDAEAVHLEGTLSGTIPGSLLERSDDAVHLDGSTVSGDLRPKDAKTSTTLVSPALDVNVAAVSVWDGVWYRTGPADPWQRASLGGTSAEAGVDINPLTLVERLRSYLATPGVDPTVAEVTCASASGRCHRVTIDAGRDPATILRAMLPLERADTLPVTHTTVTLDTDAETLRPSRLVVATRSDDGSVDVRAELDTSRWDDPAIVIEEPSATP